jgi:hypothetical protein
LLLTFKRWKYRNRLERGGQIGRVATPRKDRGTSMHVVKVAVVVVFINFIFLVFVAGVVVDVSIERRSRSSCGSFIIGPQV